ncbi:hypothetical protein BTR23_16335 [Alkalihalophilus pseudofirmus]|nr:hypothetical protein BTR23_16335 [Alkalihalophilus pseudofirmus]
MIIEKELTRIANALEYIYEEMKLSNDLNAKRLKMHDYIEMREEFLRKVGDQKITAFVPSKGSDKVHIWFPNRYNNGGSCSSMSNGAKIINVPINTINCMKCMKIVLSNFNEGVRIEEIER